MTQWLLLINFSPLFVLAIPQEAAFYSPQCHHDTQQREWRSGLKGMSRVPTEKCLCIFLSWNYLRCETALPQHTLRPGDVSLRNTCARKSLPEGWPFLHHRFTLSGELITNNSGDCTFSGFPATKLLPEKANHEGKVFRSKDKLILSRHNNRANLNLLFSHSALQWDRHFIVIVFLRLQNNFSWSNSRHCK